MNDSTRFLVLVWAAIPCFGALTIGLRYDVFALTVVGGAASSAFTVWVSVGAALAFRQEVWPQIKADIGSLID